MIEFGQYYISVDTVIDFLVKNPAAVFSAGGAIGLSALILYVTWFRPPVVSLIIVLQQLAQTLKQGSKDWLAVRERARTIVKTHPMLAVAWIETEERVISLPMGETRVHLMFGSPRDLWSPQQLLARRINLSLSEAVPNLLVGIGLLLTFFFLTIALTQATSALGPQGQAQSNLLQATQGLLGAAGAKFSTSLAGLLASVLWTIFYKRRMAELSRACEEVLAALAMAAPVGGGELAMMRQVDLASEALSTHKALLHEVREPEGAFRQFEDILAINQELLEEIREQHGTLKRFETDLAVSLGNAINPQMQSMTDKLVAAIDGLSHKLGSMNQQALEEMMKGYAATLKKATNTEMTQLRETLKYLSGQLDGAGKHFGEGAAKAASAIDQASAIMVTQVGKASETMMSKLDVAGDQLGASITNAATVIDQAGSSLFAQVEKASETMVVRMDAVGVQLAESITNAAAAIDHAGSNLLSHVGKASDNLVASATKLDEVTGNVKTAMDDLDASVKDAADLGRQGAQVVSTFIQDAKAVVTNLGTVSTGLGHTSNALQSVSGQVANVVDNIEELSREQQAVVTAVREVTPTALKAVERVTDVLNQSTQQTSTAMESTRKSMESTTTTLTKTVAAITEGVKSYTAQVVELHQKMDGNLAKAVGSFDKGISGLEEVVEELAEIMENSSKRRP